MIRFLKATMRVSNSLLPRLAAFIHGLSRSDLQPQDLKREPEKVLAGNIESIGNCRFAACLVNGCIPTVVVILPDGRQKDVGNFTYLQAQATQGETSGVETLLTRMLDTVDLLEK